MNLFNIGVIAVSIISGGALFVLLFHKLAYNPVKGDGARIVRWAVALFILAAVVPTAVDVSLTWAIFFLYSLPVFTLVLGLSAVLGFFSGGSLKRYEAKSKEALSLPVVKVKKPEVLFTDQNWSTAHNSETQAIDKFKYTNYQYDGILDVGVDNIENLPDMAGKEDKSLAYQGNKVILLYLEGVWLVIIVPSDRQMSYMVNWLGWTTSIRFISALTTSREIELAAVIHSWVYGEVDNLVLNEQDHLWLGTSILIDDANQEYKNNNFRFKLNLTHAPTSAVVKMAEAVSNQTVHDRHVSEIRDELSKRLKAISDIEETKKILYG